MLPNREKTLESDAAEMPIDVRARFNVHLFKRDQTPSQYSGTEKQLDSSVWYVTNVRFSDDDWTIVFTAPDSSDIGEE